jgi:hypothetical protein
MRRYRHRAVVALVAALLAAGCLDREPAQTCAQPLEIVTTHAMVGCGGSSVDMLIVVDDSSSMAAEQGLLAEGVLSLADLLMDPPPEWKQHAADGMRIAVVSGDMGLSWGGQPYQGGDGWPTALPQGCSSVGDHGVFKTYGAGKTVEIDGEKVACPPLNALWAESCSGWENPDLAMQAACLTQLGTKGCGFQQPLQSAAFALNRDDQAVFARGGRSVLAVIVISDEDDCSIESKDFFQVPEIQNTGEHETGLACGLPENQRHLFGAEYFFQVFRKVSNSENGTVFAAIAGVPGGEHSPCTGTGEQVDGCLDSVKMRNAPVLGGDSHWTFKPACARRENGIEVDRALPGRRYVEVARKFGPQGYVASICEPDWSPAMEDLAALIGAQLRHPCFPKPMEWDPGTKTSVCDVVVAYDFGAEDEAVCPAIFGNGQPVVEEWQEADEVTRYRVWCALPKLPAELSCRENAFYPGDPADAFGWYYCENVHGLEAENFNAACDDGLDNDDNGRTDCDDPGCAVCAACGGNGIGCGNTCRYEVLLTDTASEEIRGLNLAVRCVIRAESDDPNCRADAADDFSTDSPGGDDKGDGTTARSGSGRVAFVEGQR